MRKKTRSLTRAAMIAALYAVLTLILQPFSFGAVQLRVSEALTILPMVMADAVPGLALGCLLANLLCGAMWYDVVFGTLATLLAAVMTRKLKNSFFAAASMPVLFNALVIGCILRYAYGVALPLWLCMASVGLGQLIACYGLGYPLLLVLKKHPRLFKKQ